MRLGTNISSYSLAAKREQVLKCIERIQTHVSKTGSKLLNPIHMKIYISSSPVTRLLVFTSLIPFRRNDPGCHALSISHRICGATAYIHTSGDRWALRLPCSSDAGFA
jgi:hypothetical protein